MKLIIKEVYSNFRVDKNSKAIFVGMLQGVLEGQQLDTLDYFVVTDPEAGEFEKAVSKYAAIVGTEANVTRDGSYRAEGKTLSGLGNDGRLHQTIIITSAICRQAIMEVAFMDADALNADENTVTIGKIPGTDYAIVPLLAQVEYPADGAVSEIILPDGVELLSYLSTDYEPIPADEQEQAEILHQTYSEQSAAATGLYVKASADFTAQLVYTDSDGSSQSKSIHVQISEDAAPTQIRRYQQELDDAKAEYAELQNARLNEAAEIRKLRTYYDDFKGWAEEFDTAPLEMKRMILSHLIDRVEVGRKYQVIVKFNMKYRQFLECTAETYNTEIGA